MIWVGLLPWVGKTMCWVGICKNRSWIGKTMCLVGMRMCLVGMRVSWVGMRVSCVEELMVASMRVCFDELIQLVGRLV